MKTNRKTDNEMVLLTRRQVAERWNCCTETIKRMQRRGEIPAIIFNGRNIRYKLSDIERAEEERFSRQRTSFLIGGRHA